MNLLYKGNYSKRFEHIFPFISGKNVTEICFGDIAIAGYCRKNGINWAGIDINENFVKNAQKYGFNASMGNVHTMANFPKGDVCIIAGSLYHFHEDRETLFMKMLDCGPIIIISEPVINLSNNKGIIGKLAKASATINGKKQLFRYTTASLTAELNLLSRKLNFNYKIIGQFYKDLIIVITK